MAKQKHEQQQDEVIVDIGGSINKTEQFIEDNKKTLSIVIVGIIAIVSIFLDTTNCT